MWDVDISSHRQPAHTVANTCDVMQCIGDVTVSQSLCQMSALYPGSSQHSSELCADPVKNNGIDYDPRIARGTSLCCE